MGTGGTCEGRAAEEEREGVRMRARGARNPSPEGASTETSGTICLQSPAHFSESELSCHAGYLKNFTWKTIFVLLVSIY